GGDGGGAGRSAQGPRLGVALRAEGPEKGDWTSTITGPVPFFGPQRERRGTDMRYLGKTVGLFVLLFSGCVWHNPFVTPTTPKPAVPTEVPTKEALVGYLNDNAHRLQTIDCRRNMELDVKQRLRPPIGLTGFLVCEKQRNFRLQAQFGGNTEVDMG